MNGRRSLFLTASLLRLMGTMKRSAKARPRLLIKEWLPVTEIGIDSIGERTPMTPFPAPNCTLGGLVGRWLQAELRFWPVFFPPMPIMQCCPLRRSDRILRRMLPNCHPIAGCLLPAIPGTVRNAGNSMQLFVI